jgi:hypothetical protein
MGKPAVLWSRVTWVRVRFRQLVPSAIPYTQPAVCRVFTGLHLFICGKLLLARFTASSSIQHSACRHKLVWVYLFFFLFHFVPAFANCRRLSFYYSRCFTLLVQGTCLSTQRSARTTSSRYPSQHSACRHKSVWVISTFFSFISSLHQVETRCISIA